jgi:hypothetical protein
MGSVGVPVVVGYANLECVAKKSLNVDSERAKRGNKR